MTHVRKFGFESAASKKGFTVSDNSIYLVTLHSVNLNDYSRCWYIVCNFLLLMPATTSGTKLRFFAISSPYGQYGTPVILHWHTSVILLILPHNIDAIQKKIWHCIMFILLRRFVQYWSMPDGQWLYLHGNNAEPVAIRWIVNKP